MYLLKTGDSFMQANVAYSDDNGPQRSIHFGLRENFIKLKKDRIQWHIDATFDCVPLGFYQLLIISIFEEETNMFLPSYYVLMTSKSLRSYILVLNTLNSIIGQCSPGYVLLDFELAISRAIQTVYPSAKCTGCLFHFLQCISRRMMKYGIPKEIAFKEVEWFQLMTIVPVEEIFAKALPFIEFNILAVQSDKWTPEVIEGWKKTFSYIKKTWDTRQYISLMNYNVEKRNM